MYPSTESDPNRHAVENVHPPALPYPVPAPVSAPLICFFHAFVCFTTGGAVRNEPHGSPSEALKPPPGVVPGTPQAGLRGKTDGPGARGLDAEALAAKIFGFYSAAEGGDGGVSSQLITTLPSRGHCRGQVTATPRRRFRAEAVVRTYER